jgi:RNA polymerase sigma factor (sigma-70 family)
LKDNTDIIASIRAGGEEEIVALYQKYKSDFIGWAAFKFQLDRDAALDIFQEAVISFYDDIKQEKLTHLQHTIKTYLFAIAKNKIFNKLRYEKKFVPEQSDFDEFSSVNVADELLEITERKKIMITALAQMGEPCHTLLKLYYFDAYAMEAIAETMHYKNTDVVKSQKLRCIKELRKRIMAQFKKEDI